MYQQFIYKLHSTRILKANNNLSIDLNEARKNREIISLADSNTLRMVDIINHCDRKSISEEIKQIKFNIKQIKKLPKSIENSKKIKECYFAIASANYQIIQIYMNLALLVLLLFHFHLCMNFSCVHNDTLKFHY